MHPVLLGSLAAVSWGTLDFLAGLTSRRIGYALTTAGVTLAGLLLLTLVLALGSGFPDVGTVEIWQPLLAGAGLALATMWLFAAIASGPVSLAVPLVMSYPATTILLRALTGSVPSVAQLIAIAVIMVGIVIVAATEQEDGSGKSASRVRRTLVFAGAAHVTFLIAVLLGQHSADRFGEIGAVWVSRLGGTAAILPFVLSAGPNSAEVARLSPLLALMGALDVAALVLLFAAGQTDQPELATVCAASAGVITVVLAAVFLRERVRAARWLGIILAFTGIATLSLVK